MIYGLFSITVLSGKITANKSLTGYYRFTGKFLGHNFLNLNDSRLLVGSVSNFIYEKKKQKKLFIRVTLDEI